MKRAITGFDWDDQEDWVAWLDCGHTQHVRHQPPFVERQWVTTTQGRRRHLGHHLDCVRCDHGELPNQMALEWRSRTFNERDIPNNLPTDHGRETGIWQVVEVIRGQLRHQLPAQGVDARLMPGVAGVIPPGSSWQLECHEQASFQITCYRAVVVDWV